MLWGRIYVLGRFHRAWAALRAISLRCSFVSFLALASPPFLPPNRPKATAAGFFLGTWSGSSSPVACSTMNAASSLGSRGGLLERLGMVSSCHLNRRGVNMDSLQFIYQPKYIVVFISVIMFSYGIWFTYFYLKRQLGVEEVCGGDVLFLVIGALLISSSAFLLSVVGTLRR